MNGLRWWVGVFLSMPAYVEDTEKIKKLLKFEFAK